ncbi:MAG: hypothetical protein ACFUZC_04880 [Chthoniobacteraceae bacterium]
MDAKISSEFWEDESIGELPPECKLCALWLMTNSRRKLSGYVEISERVFKFHTGLDMKDLGRTLEALPKTFVKVGKGVWIRNFIRRQFGAKGNLVRSNCAKALCNEIEGLGVLGFSQLVTKEYPELGPLLSSSFDSSKNKPLASPSGGVREEKSRVEKSRASGRGVGETAVQGEFLGDGEPVSVDPTSIPEGSQNFAKKNPAVENEKKDAAGAVPFPEQRARFAAIFERPAGAQWSNMEMVMLSQAQPVMEVDLKLIEWRYRQPEEEGDPHRRKLHTLLENLPGEIDAARAQFKRLGGAPAPTTPRKVPRLWREILEKEYRRPEDSTWQLPPSFFDLPPSTQDFVWEKQRETDEQQETCEQ